MILSFIWFVVNRIYDIIFLQGSITVAREVAMYTDGEFGLSSKVRDRVYSARYDEFKSQGKNPREEIAKEDLAIMKDFFLFPVRFLRKFFK